MKTAIIEKVLSVQGYIKQFKRTQPAIFHQLLELNKHVHINSLPFIQEYLILQGLTVDDFNVTFVYPTVELAEQNLGVWWYITIKK